MRAESSRQKIRSASQPRVPRASQSQGSQRRKAPVFKVDLSNQQTNFNKISCEEGSLDAKFNAKVWD